MNDSALENLLSAGTVLLELESDTGDGIHATAHSYDWSVLSRCLDVHDDNIRLTSTSKITRRDLDFLVSHDFVRATCRRAAVHLHVRVYLVPYDLPGFHGCLRHRDEKVLVPARKALFSLLAKTDRCRTAWTCHVAYSNLAEPFIHHSSDTRTISEIFSDLPSPEVHPSSFLSGASPEIRAAYKDALEWIAPPGMRPLYPYQRRTVARMIQQELDPGIAIDPLYIPIIGICDTNPFYLNPSTMELLSEPPMRAQARGGILCEEMGTGKTCIILALIMATKRQLSAPEDAPWDAPERPVLTPLAFRHFRSSVFHQARAEARMDPPQASSPPSLVEILTHFISTSPERLGPPEFYPIIEQQPHLWGPLTRNVPFYHVYQSIPEMSSPRRKGVTRGPRPLFLTSATLVVVPRGIVAQWSAEINKHCDGGELRVLVLDDREKSLTIPPVQELASQYDIVLITHERFAAEQTRCDPSELYSWRHCMCEDPQGTRVPYCTCPSSKSVSPLVQIRWKRLVVDEGHVSAARNNLATLAQELSVERRWIVSGTPTRNIMGLSLGQPHEPMVASDDDTEQDEIISNASQLSDPGHLVYPSDAYANDTLLAISEGTSMDVDDQAPLPARPSRAWTNMDRDDLTRLGDMIAKFIGVPQFACEKELFRKQVAAPLLHLTGPAFGAIQVLSQLMSQVMFRHQIGTIEQEIPDMLPRLTEKTVVLRFQPLAAKTYNVLQSVIAINAVDSERTGEDYIFHAKNRGPLRDVLENLTQTMFWRTDKELFEIDRAVQRAENALQTALERGRPESDIELVKQSIQVQKDAAADTVWRDVMRNEENPFVVHGLSPPIQAAWQKLDASPPHQTRASLLNPDRVLRLRDVLTRSPLISEDRLIEHGHNIIEEEKKRLAQEEHIKSLKRKRKLDESQPAGLNPKLRKENLKAGSKEKLKEINRELDIAIGRKERGTAEDTTSSFQQSASSLLRQTTFTALRIGNSLSSKVNYILKEVLDHSKQEKFLIFSALPLSLAYLAEALQVVHVPHLQYTFGVKPRVRQQTVVTFETSDKYRVLLMELKLGARGLNLVTASRIIFCEPVWQGDLESQAIKRAHRIGQKNDHITVSTLVMAGTSEEVMMTRRRAMKRKLDKLPAVEEDVGMRKFLENPTFIESKDVESHALDVAGIDIPLLALPDPVLESVHGGDIDIETSGRSIRFAPFPETEDEGEAPAKKPKTVRFG